MTRRRRPPPGRAGFASLGAYVLNAAGEPEPATDALAWGAWMATASRHVADTQVGPVRISTVFLGLDHSFGHGRPVLWETLVFGGIRDGAMYRYETRDQAERGHQQMVDVIRDDARPAPVAVDVEGEEQT